MIKNKTKNYRLVLLVFNFIFYFTYTFTHEYSILSLAQSMQETVWGVGEGLPSNEITDIIQDEHGYIWIGTYGGLVRFDGVKFTIYNSSSKNEFAINSPRTMFKDSKNNIWIGTNDGQVIIMKDSKVIKRYNDFSGRSIRSIAELDNGEMLIGTTAGLLRIKSGNEIELSINANIDNSTINKIIVNQDKEVFLASNVKNLYKLYPDKSLESYEELEEYIVNDIDIDKKGFLWIATRENGIIKFKDGKIIEKFNKETGFLSNQTNSISINKDGKVLCGTENGFYLINGNYIEKMTSKEGLKNDLVDIVFEDREDNIWLGMSRGGLAKLSRRKFFKYAIEHGLENNTVNTVHRDKDGYTWVGTDKGLNIIFDKKVIHNKLTEYLEGKRIRHIMTDKKNNIWISTYSDLGAVFYDKVKNEILNFNQEKGLTGNRIRVIFEDSKGRIWIGTTSGLNYLSDMKIVETYTREDGLSNDYIMCIEESASGEILLGTDGGGINKLSGKNVSVINIKDGLSSNIIFKIYRDSQGDTWISNTNGLNLISKNQIYSYNLTEIISEKAISQIIEDKFNNYWIITPSVVLKTNKNLLKKSIIDNTKYSVYEVYDTKDGLTSGISATSWSGIDEEQNLWFSTNDGVATLDPNSISKNMIEPIVKIEKLYLDGKAQDALDELVVDAGTRRVVIDYTALSFVIPERVKFKYKLEGFDNEWSEETDKREATYTNLKPGNYIFKVKAANNDYIWSETAETIKIIQKPFFYQTKLFILLLLLTLLIVIYIIFKIRLRVYEQRQIELEKVVALRTKELKQEKEKSEDLLLNILPQNVAEELKREGVVTPELSKDAVVMFADIVGFTKKAQCMHPKDLIKELNEIFTKFDEISYKYEVERIKTIGDCYMAIYNKGKNYRNLIFASIEMRDWLAERNLNEEIKWEMRFGISSGDIIGGVVGITKYIYDVFGDTINIASRMESFSEPMKVNVSQSIFEFFKDEFVFEKREKVYKRENDTIEMYFVEIEK